MTYLLSGEGRRALRKLTTRPILYAFDFVGTLAPISSNRDEVKISRSLAEWLKELSKRVPCAVVSGRALRDLTPRVDGLVPHVIGNHGIESSWAPLTSLIWAEGICQGWKHELKTNFAQTLENLGVEVEDKRYSLTMHFRGAMEQARIRTAMVVLLRQLSPPPYLIMGKSSVNALPLGQRGKGAAVLNLMVSLRQAGVFFVGDDETDETVFGLTEGLAMGVRIGHHADSQARYYLKNQGELEQVLRFLVHRLDRTPDTMWKTDDERDEGNLANDK